MVIRITIILLCSLFSVAQTPKASYHEIRWALFHPFAALKVKALTARGNEIMNSINIRQELDSFSSGGKADAFRHIFFMAVYAQKIRPGKLIKLGMAHERSNYRDFLRHKKEYGAAPDSLSSVMDLKNNELGVSLGCNNDQVERAVLAGIVIGEIKKGKAFILLRDKDGHFLKCDGSQISLDEFSGKWNVPKCLVRSDHKPSSD